MYYISYATSAAGALMFWEESQEDYFAAADHYLAFTAQDPELGFLGSFKNAGMSSPFSESTIKKVDSCLKKNLLFVFAWYDADGQMLACTVKKVNIIRDDAPTPPVPAGAEGYDTVRLFYLDPDTYVPLYDYWSS